SPFNKKSPFIFPQNILVKVILQPIPEFMAPISLLYFPASQIRIDETIALAYQGSSRSDQNNGSLGYSSQFSPKLFDPLLLIKIFDPKRSHIPEYPILCDKTFDHSI